MTIKVHVSNIRYEDEGADTSCCVNVDLLLAGGKPIDRMDKLSALVRKIGEIEL